MMHSELRQAVQTKKDILDPVHPAHRMGLRNLIHYLALRSHDVRQLQNRLHNMGLSSLSSAESHIYAQLGAVLQMLDVTEQENEPVSDMHSAALDIEKKSKKLFGSHHTGSIPYIMVTFKSEYADDYDKVKQLLSNGMRIARINCAHDDEITWTKMVSNVKKAASETGLECKIYMDIAGPKIRTMFLGANKKSEKIALGEGQCLVLAEKNAAINSDFPVVGCTVPGIISKLTTGKKVFFDDGLIACTVDKVEKDIAILRIDRVSTKKPFLKKEKGINFPGTQLAISPLTDFDKKNLSFICRQADLVGYSFVNSVEDIQSLQELLARGEKKPAIVLKIETKEAFESLPKLIIQAMKDEVFGVMIARGDLAVEVGFERLSEVQDEILWICEAAHVPVIWATQVLESLNHVGLATRAEITDAVHGAMAECVMINKGSHVMDVLKTLRDILERSGEHQYKKRYMFRPLHIAKQFFQS